MTIALIHPNFHGIFPYINHPFSSILQVPPSMEPLTWLVHDSIAVGEGPPAFRPWLSASWRHIAFPPGRRRRMATECFDVCGSGIRLITSKPGALSWPISHYSTRNVWQTGMINNYGIIDCISMCIIYIYTYIYIYIYTYNII